MAVPDFQTLMLPVLRAAAEGEIRMGECVARIVADLHLSDEDVQERLDSGRSTRLYNRAAWAKTHLSHAELLESPRYGVFRATQRGLDLLAANPRRIDMKALMAYPGYVEFRKGEKLGPEPNPPPETPEERIEAAVGEITKDLKASLLDRLRAAGPDLLERVVVDLLGAMGFGHALEGASEVLGRSGDGGIDGVIRRDELGLEAVYVQAKRYQADHAVTAEQIRGFSGALTAHGASLGVFVTTSTFTSGAHQTADTVKTRQRIVLIDGDRLAALLVAHSVGVRMDRRIDLKRLDQEYFEAEATPPGVAGRGS